MQVTSLMHKGLIRLPVLWHRIHKSFWRQTSSRGHRPPSHHDIRHKDTPFHSMETFKRSEISTINGTYTNHIRISSLIKNNLKPSTNSVHFFKEQTEMFRTS